jgi:hypothetical protein
MTKIEYVAGDGKTVLKIEISEHLDRAVATTRGCMDDLQPAR